MGVVKHHNKVRGPDHPMPWSLGLPVFDEKLGRYVHRKPVKETPKPGPKVGDNSIEWTPFHKGYDARMKMKRAEEKKRMAEPKKSTRRQTEKTDLSVKPPREDSAHVVGPAKPGKKRKNKYFWEKPKARRPRKVLSTRGERV